jgi:hypothetical protein
VNEEGEDVKVKGDKLKPKNELEISEIPVVYLEEDAEKKEEKEEVKQSKSSLMSDDTSELEDEEDGEQPDTLPIKIISSGWFTLFSLLMIIGNTVILACESYYNTPSYNA